MSKKKQPILSMTLLWFLHRSRKDIQTLKNAVISAESIHSPHRMRLYDLYHDILSLDGFLQGIISKRM